MRIIFKSLIALASTATVAAAGTIAVKKNEKCGKLYDQAVTSVENLKEAAVTGAAAGVTVYQAARQVQASGAPTPQMLAAAKELDALSKELEAIRKQRAELAEKQAAAKKAEKKDKQ